MKRDAQYAVMTMIGTVAAVIAWSGAYLRFVKEAMQWPLLVAGLLLFLIGFYGLVFEDEHAAGREADAGGLDVHDHREAPRIGWLLVLPFLLLFVADPPALGSFAAERDSGAVVRPSEDLAPTLSPVPAGEPVSMSLTEYSLRALLDGGQSVQGATVRLVGFVSPRPGDRRQEWYLTRMSIACCAADGFAVKVDVRGGARYPDNTWVEVVGTWLRPAGDPLGLDTLAALQVEQVTRVAAPASPYE